MKSVIKITMIIGLGVAVLQAGAMKKYEVKSGNITYELKGSGNVLGMSKIESVGKKRLIFDDYGAKELEEKVEVKKQTVMGETKTNKTHILNYMNGAVIYKVDFKKKKINRMKNKGAVMAAAVGGGRSLKETGEAMMKSMGGKKIGTESILGYTCVVWDLMGVKQCIYKGVPLKIESNMAGLKNIEVATKAVFDIDLNEKSFKLPDFPVYEFDMDKLMDGGKPTLLDKTKLTQMDEKANAQASIDAKKGAEAMKGMAAGMAALKEAGVDFSKDLTPEQEQIMQKAMMKAMGGESKIVAKMKKEMLDDAQGIDFAQKCFGSASTLSEVNRCVDKGNQMFHDDQENFASWTAQDKKEELKEIAAFKEALPCIKAAHTMQALQRCLPMD